MSRKDRLRNMINMLNRKEKINYNNKENLVFTFYNMLINVLGTWKP